MKIEVKGAIISDGAGWVYDWLDIPYTSPSKVNNALSEAGGQEIEVIINSGGGSVFAGSEIYTALKEYQGRSRGKIVGIAASAASVISMGVDVLSMSPTAQFMIHNASIGGVSGDKKDLKHQSNVLNGIDKSIANAYMLKTNLSHKELLRLMDKESWLTAQEAKEKGFIDEIMFENSNSFSDSITNCANNDVVIPQAVIDKIMQENIIKTSKSNNSINQENKINQKRKLELQLDLI